MKSFERFPWPAFQRLGDSNQTLYEDDGAAPAYWTPGPGCIPLDTSRRFGGEIAGFASRLTARQAQTIVGLGIRPASRVMFLFDEGTIGGVLGAFAEEARALWGDECSTRDVWAVASRRNLPGKKGAWQPKSLVDCAMSFVTVLSWFAVRAIHAVENASQEMIDLDRYRNHKILTACISALGPII